MNIFDSYTQRVKNSLQLERASKSLQEFRSNFSGIAGIKSQGRTIGAVPRSLMPENSLLTLNQVVQNYDISDAQVGKHPDFRHLIGSEKTERHYITSAFIDIKGSTQLNDVYELDTLYNITDTILSAAIHVSLLYGGHIQRLQGDGVFVYFGGKTMAKADSVRLAVTAASMFTYFVKNDLQKLFEEDDVLNICTRAGIDYGDDQDVIWGNFGVGNCIELTTQSLHTSLASKCQQNAGRNGIVVGDHVKEMMRDHARFFDYVQDAKGEIDRYVYEGRRKGLYYKQHKLDWFGFLKSLPYIQCNADGNLFVISPEKQEEERLRRLRNTASIITSGAAYTAPSGRISNDPSGIKNKDHRFHCA